MTVFDFVEFLAKGIEATRSGRCHEALDYLRVAAQVQPDNPRVWLWSAAACDSSEDKRRYLNYALELDPGSEMPRLLLARLDRSDFSGGQKLSQEASFICDFCGGKQRFDPDVGALICDYCHRTEMLSKNNPAQTSSFHTTGNWSVGDNQIVCNACGARISIPHQQNTVCCPFCASEYVIVRPASQDLLRPDSILPFKIHSDDIAGLLTHKKSRNSQVVIGSQQSIYLPFWCFSGRVSIYLGLGRWVPLKVFSPVDRVVAKGDWPSDGVGYQNYNTEKKWPGDSHFYELTIRNSILYAGHSFSPGVLSEVFPFDLQELVDYRDEILAGWQAELYQIALDDARVVACRQFREQAIHSAAERWLFIEPQKLLEDDVIFEDMIGHLVLLPHWVCHFKQGDQIQRALLNGQSGKSVIV